MNVDVNGKAMDQAEIERLRARAAELHARPELQPRPGQLDETLLGDVSDVEAFDRAFLARLRDRTSVDTASFPIPRKPGLIGRCSGLLRSFLWKLLRYQHDRMAGRQNRINALIVGALENETTALRAEIAGLKARIDRLEQRGEGRPGVPPS